MTMTLMNTPVRNVHRCHAGNFAGLRPLLCTPGTSLPPASSQPSESPPSLAHPKSGAAPRRTARFLRDCQTNVLWLPAARSTPRMCCGLHWQPRQSSCALGAGSRHQCSGLERGGLARLIAPPAANASPAMLSSLRTSAMLTKLQPSEPSVDELAGNGFTRLTTDGPPRNF
jgi:hypothetical protein